MRKLTRRSVMHILVGTTASLGLAACAPAPASPAASPKPAEKPAAPSPTAAAPRSEASPAAQKPAPATPPPKPAAPTAAQAKPRPIVKWSDVQTGPQLYNAFFMMASRKGLDKPNGIDLSIEFLAPANLNRVVVTGERDSSIIAFSTLPTIIEQGGDVKGILSVFHRVPHRLVVRKEVNSLRDLYGQSFTIPAPNTLSDALIKAAMKQDGLDPDQLKFVAIGGAEAARAAAFVAGQIDAGTVPPEYLPTVLSNPAYKVMFGFAEKLPNYIRQVHYVSTKTIKERPDSVLGYVLAILQATRYSIEHKDETLALGAEVTGEKPENLSGAFDDYIQNRLINPDGNVTPEAVRFMQEINISTDQQKRILPVEQVWDSSFVDEAVKRLGKYTWKS